VEKTTSVPNRRIKGTADFVLFSGRGSAIASDFGK
jgi:hypothetical protein